MAPGEEERGSQRGYRRNGASRSGTMTGVTGNVLSIARHSVLIALGGGALLADVSGSLFGLAAATGEKYLRAVRAWQLPVITFGRLERKR